MIMFVCSMIVYCFHRSESATDSMKQMLQFFSMGDFCFSYFLRLKVLNTKYQKLEQLFTKLNFNSKISTCSQKKMITAINRAVVIRRKIHKEIFQLCSTFPKS